MSVTAAPGMTAPCGSLTVPATKAVVICADAGATIVHRAITAATTIERRLLTIMNLSIASSARTSETKLIAGAHGLAARDDDLDQLFTLHGTAGLVLQASHDSSRADVNYVAGRWIRVRAIEVERNPARLI